MKKLARPFQSDIHAKRTYRELRLLKHFRHENVISMLDVFTPNDSFESFHDIYFVTHLMGADLNNIIRTQRLTDEHVQFLTYQVTYSASVYFWTHRLSNTFFFIRFCERWNTSTPLESSIEISSLPISLSTKTASWEFLILGNFVSRFKMLKLYIFSLARHANEQMTGYVATRWYRAPEIMLNWVRICLYQTNYWH